MGATSLLNFVLVSDNITIKIYDLAYWSSDKKNEIEGLFCSNRCNVNTSYSMV